MDRDDLFFLLLGSLGGLAGYRAAHEQISTPEPEPEPKKKEKTFFVDCPECALPAELAVGYAYVLDGNWKYSYILQCLGDHEPPMVSDDWLVEQIGE